MKNPFIELYYYSSVEHKLYTHGYIRLSEVKEIDARNPLSFDGTDYLEINNMDGAYILKRDLSLLIVGV